MQQTKDKIETPRCTFITGANDFTGRRLAQCYRELGSQLRCIDCKAAPDQKQTAGCYL